MRWGRVLVVVLAVLGLPGCLVLGGDEEDAVAVWDLRETRSVEAVGWPDDAGSAWEATTDGGEVDRILLADGVEVDGTFRANPARDGGLRGRPYDDQLRSLVVTFEPEPIDAVMTRAEGYAEQLDVDLDDLRAWASRNADGMSADPGGAQATSGEATLSDGAVVHLEARAFADGPAVLRLSAHWPDALDP